MKNYIMLFLKGFIVGGSMLVPGVSGGSMAIILGVYDELIHATSNFFKNTKKHLTFLFIFVLGTILGFVVIANPLKRLIAWNEKLVMYFFIGAVAGSIPMIFRKARAHKLEFRSLFYILVGLFFMWLVAQIPENSFAAKDGIAGILTQAAGGVLASTALVLPGISVSYLLVVMGIYQSTLSAIAALDIIALLPFVIGLLIGIAACIKLLSYLLTRHPKPTYMVILGFILGSLAEIFPGMPLNFYEWGMGIAIFAAGFFAIVALSKYE